MLKGLTNALRLELIDMKERWLSLLFYLVAPVLIIGIYSRIAIMVVTWGSYASLKLTLYDLFAPGVISIIIIFVAVQLMVLRIVGERAPYGTLDRELITISRTGMYLGKLFANLIFLTIQAFLILITIYYIFPLRNYTSIWHTFIFLYLIAIFGLVLGYTLSILAKTKEQAIQLVPFFVLILLLLSGTMIPLDQMPENISSIAKNSPLTIGIIGWQRLTLDGVGIEDVIPLFYKLIAWIVLIILIGSIKFRFEANR